MNKIFRKTSVWLGSVIAGSLLASTALAQNGRFDGSSAAQAAQQKASVSVSCGVSVASLTRTENANLTFSNTGFLALPGSAVVVNVPSGATRCVKVLFTAEAAATNFCYIRAIENGIPLNPNGAGFQALASFDSTANAHSYLWVRRVGAGSHTFLIQRRVNAGSCAIDDWTVDVSVYR